MADKEKVETTEKPKEPEPAETVEEVPTDDTPTVEDLQARIATMDAALKKANHEAASRRKKLEEFEGKEEELKRAKMDELERASADLEAAQAETAKMQAEREEAIQALNKERLNNMIERVARSLHFHDENDAKARIDMAMVVQDEETGQWDEKSVEKALKKLAEENKHLIDEGNSKGRVGTPARGRQLQERGRSGTPRGEQVRSVPTRAPTL